MALLRKKQQEEFYDEDDFLDGTYDDEDYEEDEFDDDLDDDYEEPVKAKRGLFGRGNKKAKVQETLDDEFEDDEFEDSLEDDEYEDDEVETPKKRGFGLPFGRSNQVIEEFDEYDYDDEPEETDEERYQRIKEERKASLLEEENEIKQYYEMGLSMEEIERREYLKARKEAMKAEVDKQKQDRADFFESFSQPTTIFGFLGFYAVNVFYLWLLTGQIGFALLIGLLGAYQLTKWFIFKEHQLDIQEGDLKQLEGLANDISFESQAGKNVYRTLQSIQAKEGNYFGRVEDDIRYTYKTLERETELDLTNFETYQFTPFNLFLRNVSIWYTEGVPVKQMFDKSIKHISFELVQRNKLRLMLKKGLNQELLASFISLMMPVVLRFAAPAQYRILMAQPLSLTILVFVFYILQLKVISGMKKRSLDITIR